MKLKFLHYLAALSIVCMACGPAFAQWSTFQGGIRHDGYAPLSLDPTTMSLLWQRSLTTSALNPVTVGNGEVYVSGYFGSGKGLQALDAATGQTKWSKDYGAVSSVNPPSYANGKVYIQTCNHTPNTYLWAYEATTGTQIFSAPFSAQWEQYYAPTICDNTVYINGGYYGGMYAFDGSTGQQKWFISLAQYDNWTPTLDAKYAYAYAGNAFSAVNRATGLVDFKISDPNYNWNGYDMNQAVALGAHDNAFTINGNRLICFDLKNKNIKWQVTRTFGNSGQATVAKGVIYAIDGGKLAALDELTGALLWTWTPPSSGTLTGTIVVTKMHVLASSSSATYAVDLNTHESVWSYPLGGKLALSDRALYIANTNGTLAAISFPSSAIFPVPPTALSIEVTSPTSSPNYFSNATPITISGTASELDSLGEVMGNGSLVSVTWVNNRGGSGIGSYDNSYTTPSTWLAAGVLLKPGNNVITVTATDLWGHTASDSITVATPVGLSIGITSPTSNNTYISNTTPITLSGTASATDAAGGVIGSASLSAVTWSNNRGGTGTGTFTNTSPAPSTWSATGIALQPGENIITVSATDVWGNTATDVITVTAPNGLSIAITSPTSQPSYLTYGSPIALSGTASELDASGAVLSTGSLVSLTWTNSRGGSGTGTFSTPVSGLGKWSIASIALQGGNNTITVTATDLWGSKASAVITVNWSPGSIGAAKKVASGTMVYVQNAVVTATSSITSGSVFVESPDRSAGIRLVTNQPLNVGDRVSFTGTSSRVNGEYQISSVTFQNINAGTPLSPWYMTSKFMGNDRTETLNYVGLNTTGLLVRMAGKVTGTISTQQTFYLDDGGRYRDGIIPVYGIRVHLPAGIALPKVGKWVVVTGISRVEKLTLTGWGDINGDWYPVGTIAYTPSIWARNANDVQVLSVSP